MRTLLRHKTTGFYLQAPGKWTQNASRAFDFRSVDEAIKFISTWNLQEAELAFAFDELTAVMTRVPRKPNIRAD